MSRDDFTIEPNHPGIKVTTPKGTDMYFENIYDANEFIDMEIENDKEKNKEEVDE